MINPLCTLAEFLVYDSPRQQTANADAVDDGTISTLIDAVSHYIEQQTWRTFTPRYETRTFDVPDMTHGFGNQLDLDDDLLEVVSITNGDGTTVTNNPTKTYNLKPNNGYPKRSINLISSTTTLWSSNSTNDDEGVISVSALWGFRDQYDQHGWSLVGTLGAAMADTTTASLTMTAGHSLKQDTVIKIDTELFNVKLVSTNAVTLNQRGDNGSTAATHLISAPVYVWNVQPEIHEAALMIVQNMYAAKIGQPTSVGKVTVTAAGVVIRPEDIPSMSQKIIDSYGLKY